MNTSISHLVTLFLCLYSRKTFALPDTIVIGGIFGPEDERQEMAFKYAIESINNDMNTLQNLKLEAEIEPLPADDSFQASIKVCDMLGIGIAGIFGPQSENTANHVQSICDAKEVPHIETRWDFKLTRDEYSINLYPHPASLSQAYYDVVKAMAWKSFVILYDSNIGLVRLQTLLKVKEWKVTIRELNDGENWRPLLKDIKKSQETKFVIDVAQDKVSKILKQATQIGLMSAYHSYFITSLDMNLVDIEDFRYGGANISSLRLLDPNKPEVQKVVDDWSLSEFNKHRRNISPELRKITTESALMYDAVHLFARALNDLDRSNVVDISPLYCEGDQTWQHGRSLINYMKWYGSRRIGENFNEPYSGSQVNTGGMSFMTSSKRRNQLHPLMSEYRDRSSYQPLSGASPTNLTLASIYDQVQVYGLTGLIKFDQEGFRTDFQLEITEMDPNLGMKKVGLWTKQGANFTRSYSEVAESISQLLQNRTLTVTTAESPPYTMLKENHEAYKGNDQFEGFCIDLMEKLSKHLKFNFTLKLVGDGKYGNRDKHTGEWNGMVRELLDHKADLGIVDFTITYEREEAVDFSMPFMNLGIAIIYKRPQKKDPSLFSFMSPFSIDVWIYMATAYLGVSVLLFILARMAPSEWDSPYPCIDEPEELENCFTLQNSLWFIIATFLCQGADIAPRAVSTRIVAGIWWFFTLIMISSYTANLAAFLTVERMDSPITGAEDLAKQTKIKYGCKQGGSTYAFFSESKISTYQRMWAAMSNARPSVFTDSNEAGVDRVSNADGMFAFLMESSSIDYEVERKCDLMQVGGLLDSKSYGIALPPGSPYTNCISEGILKLKEEGVLHQLKNKWWKGQKGGGHCVREEGKDAAAAAELGLDNVGGVFVVMVVGGAVACLVACCEFTWKARKLAAQEGDSFWDELWLELKFIGQCGKNDKPVRKAKSPETDSTTIYSNNYGYAKK